jgi:F-type H+-transporting ATPase subunit alpha
MKQVAGTLRLDLASFRSLEAFAQFGSDLDKATQNQLNRGARMVELLKQGRLVPMPVQSQVLAVFAGTKGFLDDLAVEDVQPFRDGFIEYASGSYADVVNSILTEGKITDEIEGKLKGMLEEYKGIFLADRGDDAPVASSDSGE